MALRAAIYARYSSDLQNPTSIDDQVAMAKRLCIQNGWTVTQVFSDSEMTGKRRARPGLDALLAAAKRGEVDVIVAESIDRLHRKVSHSLNTWDMLSYRDIRVITVNEGEQDFLKVMIYSLGAQMYSESVADHTKRGFLRALEAKQHLHSLAFGYRRRDAETGPNREIDPEQAAVVLRIFEEAAAGHSAEQIARGLNRDGIPAPRGGTWQPTALRGNIAREEGILRNRLYIGMARYGANTNRFDPEDGSKTVVQTPKARIDVEIPELRIVPQELWDAAQAALATTARKSTEAGNPSAGHRTKYPLSGLLVCAQCGGPYIVVGKNRYGCRNHRHALCENAATIRKDRIEARVFARLRGRLLTPELTARFDKALAAEQRKLESANGVGDLKRLATRKADAEKARANILRAIEEGAPYETFRNRVAEIEAEFVELEARVRELEALRVRGPRRFPQSAAEAYAAALERLEVLLADPEVIHAVHEHLAVLIRSIALTPDSEAPDAHPAEILADLGSLLSGAGWPKPIAARLAANPQLTAGLGAEPPIVIPARKAPGRSRAASRRSPRSRR